MAKANVKKVSKQQKSKPVSKRGSSKRPPLKCAAPESVGRWETEIQALLREEFETEEDAINALIDRVLVRFKSGKERERERKFLFDLLTLDPTVMSALTKAVRIKRRRDKRR